MADSKVIESDRSRGSCEQSLADQSDQKENDEPTDPKDIKREDSLGLRSAGQEEWFTDEDEGEEDDEEEECSVSWKDEDKKTSDEEEEEREVGKNSKGELEREEEEEAEEKEDKRHKEPTEAADEDRELENIEDEDADKEDESDNSDKDSQGSDGGGCDNRDRVKIEAEEDDRKINDNKGYDNEYSGKSFTDGEREDDGKRENKGKSNERGQRSGTYNVQKTAPSGDFRADIEVEDSDGCDVASVSRSKGDSPLARSRGQTPCTEAPRARRGASEAELDTDERRRRKTDSEDDDGSNTEDGKDTDDARDNEEDGDDSEDAKDNEDDSEDAEDAAADAENNEEDGDGAEDDRVLVERGGKFSFLSVRELNSQEKKLYGLVSSDSVPALASTPKLHPSSRRPDKKQTRLPLLGAKRGREPAGVSGPIGSRLRNRGPGNDDTVTRTISRKAEKVGDSISATAATTTVRTVQRRRSEKTTSCPTVSLTDRRKPGWTSTLAGPPKTQTADKTRSQELRARCSRSAGGDAQPSVEPGTLYRSPYAFSPESRRELGRRLRDRMENEKTAEQAKRLEEEGRRMEAEQAFSVWVETKKRQTLCKDGQDSNPKLTKKLIEATQRDAAEAAFNEWLLMKKRQRMEEMRRRDNERQRYLLALENAIADRQQAEKAYKRWVKKKQKPALLKKRRIGVAASGATSGRHHVTGRGQRMLAAASMRRESSQRPSRCLLRNASSNVSQFPSQQMSLATAANYFRLLYNM